MSHDEFARIFLTSYQKAGTHQIMPALRIGPHIASRSGNDMIDLPPRYGDWYGREVDMVAVEQVSQRLREFEKELFGHISYRPEYASAVQAIPTKVIFNVRDPRDIIVAEMYSARRGEWPDLFIAEYRKRIHDLDDPISELIEIAACRWPKWLGWLDHDFVMKVKYEDLRLKAEETLLKMKVFLWPYHIDVHTCLPGLNPKPKNPTFRRGVPGEWKELFTPEHVEKANRMLGDIIQMLGYSI